MQQDKNNQFKVPDNEQKESDDSSLNKSDTNQEPTPKVDNFSPPQSENVSGDSSGSTFQVPTDKDVKSEPASEPEQTQTIKPESEGEPEDLFETKPQAQAEPAQEQQSPTPEPTGTIKAESGEGDGQKFNVPTEKKGSGCLWIIAVVLIFILIGVAITLNEFGVFNLGIEKYYGAIHLERLWGGLPKESKNALGKAVLKMKDKSYNIEGTDSVNFSINVEGSSSSADTTAEAMNKDIVAKMLKEGIDTQGEVKINAKIKNKNKVEVALKTDIDSKAIALLELLKGSEAVDLTVVYDNTDIYVKNTSLAKILNINKEWVKITDTNVDGSASSSLAKASDLILGGERIGTEKINGVSCYVYDVRFNSSAFEGFIANNFPAFFWIGRNISVTSAKFYLGKRDHYIYKTEINFSNSIGDISQKSKVVINFSGFGSNIEIVIPNPSEVSEKTWADIRGNFVSTSASPTPTTTPADTPEQRDIQRKADIKKIQDALLSYKVKNGKYPSTTGVMEKTRDETSALKTALVPTYINSLPVDPLDPQYFYGYKSDDGSKCQLTSILEVRTDPDGEEMGGYWIYKLLGN